MEPDDLRLAIARIREPVCAYSDGDIELPYSGITLASTAESTDEAIARVLNAVLDGELVPATDFELKEREALAAANRKIDELEEKYRHFKDMAKIHADEATIARREASHYKKMCETHERIFRVMELLMDRAG